MIGSYDTSATLSIPVVLTIVAPIPLLVSPNALVFNMTAGLPPGAPVTEELTITVPAASPVTVQWTATAATMSGGNWLYVDAASGVAYPSGTSQPYNVAGINAGTLPSGSYVGAITVTAPGASNSPVSIPVTLNINSPLALNSISPNTIAAGSSSFLLTAKWSWVSERSHNSVEWRDAGHKLFEQYATECHGASGSYCIRGNR